MSAAASGESITAIQKRIAAIRDAEQKRLLSQMLPLWPDYERAYPNELIRCSLFGLHSDLTVRSSALRDRANNAKRGVRKYVSQMPVIRTNDGIEMWYEGQLLGQRDFDIIASLAHRGRGLAYSQRIEFSLYDLLLDLGWSVANDHTWLATRLLALTNAQVFVLNRVTGKRESQGHLLRKAVITTSLHATNAYTLGPYVHRLYTGGEYTRISWDQRKALIAEKNSLAEWFHLHHSSHAPPLPYTVSLWARLSGLKLPDSSDPKYAEKLRALRHRIVKAHRLLKAHKIIETHTIRKASSYDDDFEYCIGAVRELSASQTRHVSQRLLA